MQALRYDGLTVVVTGAGAGLGKAYAVFFGSRGANVVVNDLGGSTKGDGKSTKAADLVVDEIIRAGGKAAANYDSVEYGDRVIQTAIDAFGRVDILINNAGILRDVSFKKIKDADWDIIMKVHLRGAYACTKAAWPYFLKQGFGRIIQTTSDSALFGNFGQTNYCAAKFALVGFSKALAKEGAGHNILVNCISPAAGSRLTATYLPPDIFKNLHPDWVVPVVAFLVHPGNQRETGGVFESGGGFVAKLRWQQAGGAHLQPDQSLTPGAILRKWSSVNDFSHPAYPESGPNESSILETALALPRNVAGEEPSFKDRVVLITGAGTRLGRAYALLFAKYGASVVVNDVGSTSAIVEEMQALGAKAVVSATSDANSMVKTAIDSFGRLDILVNNAGTGRNQSFHDTQDADWQGVIDANLRATYEVTQAAWPFFLKQRYGRIVNVSNPSGIYGKSNEASHSAAMSGLYGFAQSLCLEGAKNNILVNTVAPVATDREAYVAPLIGLLGSDLLPHPATGGLYEVAPGWVGRTRWERSGHGFFVDINLTPELVSQKWREVAGFVDGNVDHPASVAEATIKIHKNCHNKSLVVPSKL